MRIPSTLYGPYRDVKSRTRRAVTAAARSGRWNETLSNDGFTDTAAAPGLLVLHGPSPLLGTGSHFHCYLPWSLRSDALDASADEIFHASLETEWGTLGLLAQTNVMWAVPPRRHKALLDAVLRHWPVLFAEGDRYTAGSTTPQDLWSLHTNLKYVLANHGAPNSVLQAPLPTGGLAAIVAMTDAGSFAEGGTG